MKDPYLVLGVSKDATNDEIKKAYRALCRKYHPDVNRDNPNREEYKQKFTEVGEAYRTIMDMRSGKSQSNYSSYSDYSQNSDYSDADSRLRAASVYLQRGYFREALNTLNSITERNAMWYYLSAVANARLGNLIIAREHAKTAVGMEPGNVMYQRLYSSLSGNGGFYRDYQSTGSGTYGRQVNIDTDYCLKCCAANIALNLCCGRSFCC